MRSSILFLFLATIGNLVNAQPITLGTLLEEMTSRDAIARFPSPAYTNRQSSSYDRRTKSKSEGWFANGDRSYFVRTETNDDGRIEHVMHDEAGPGAIVRFWAVTSALNLLDGTLRIYIDGEETPTFSGKLGEMVGEEALAEYPFSSNCAVESPRVKRGNNLYLPIPYASHCTITYEKPDGKLLIEGEPAWPSDAVFYNINYRTYAPGTQVESLTAAGLSAAQSRLDAARRTLVVAKQNAGVTGANTELQGALAAGESRSMELNAANGDGASIRGLKLQLAADDLPQALRSTVVEMTFDGDQTVWCPAGDFFGTGYQIRETKSWYGEVSADGLMACHWVMPFEKHASVTLHNLGEQSVEVVTGEVATGDWDWDDRSMHFSAAWRQESSMRTKPDHDVNYVTLEGRGVYAGDSLTLYDAHAAWWGEGDEKIFVDGEDFPSHFGTGSEDYYGYAWCLGAKFATPFIGQPDGTGNEGVGFSVNNRYRLLDGIPFTSRLQFDMEVMHWRDTYMNYAPTTYWYALPGCESNIRPDADSARMKVARDPSDVIPATAD